jgi:hypothetical protein
MSSGAVNTTSTVEELRSKIEDYNRQLGTLFAEKKNYEERIRVIEKERDIAEGKIREMEAERRRAEEEKEAERRRAEEEKVAAETRAHQLKKMQYAKDGPMRATVMVSPTLSSFQRFVCVFQHVLEYPCYLPGLGRSNQRNIRVGDIFIDLQKNDVLIYREVFHKNKDRVKFKCLAREKATDCKNEKFWVYEKGNYSGEKQIKWGSTGSSLVKLIGQSRERQTFVSEPLITEKKELIWEPQYRFRGLPESFDYYKTHDVPNVPVHEENDEESVGESVGESQASSPSSQDTTTSRASPPPGTPLNLLRVSDSD